MEDIYKTPESSLDNGYTSSQNYQLYKVSGVGIATFFGTLFAGGVLLYFNFKRLGRQAAARNALIYSVLGLLAVLAVTLIIPEDMNLPSIGITVMEVIVMMQIAKQQLGRDIDNHVEQGGVLASDWKAFGVSLLVLLLLMPILAGIGWLYYEGTV